MILHFTDKIISFKIDTDSIETNASNEFEKDSEEFGEKIIDQLSFDVDYLLKNNTITWEKSSDKSKFSIKKDKKNLVLTPDKSNKNQETLTLKPYQKKRK